MASDEQAATSGEREQPGPARRPWWRSRIVLVLGALACLTPLWLAPRPSRRAVIVRIDDAASVTRVHVAWSEGGDLLAETTLHFAPGFAPSAVAADVTLPDGSYDLELAIDRGGVHDRAFRKVAFTGDEAETTIFAP